MVRNIIRHTLPRQWGGKYTTRSVQTIYGGDQTPAARLFYGTVRRYQTSHTVKGRKRRNYLRFSLWERDGERIILWTISFPWDARLSFTRLRINIIQDGTTVPKNRPLHNIHRYYLLVFTVYILAYGFAALHGYRLIKILRF